MHFTIGTGSDSLRMYLSRHIDPFIPHSVVVCVPLKVPIIHPMENDTQTRISDLGIAVQVGGYN